MHYYPRYYMEVRG